MVFLSILIKIANINLPVKNKSAVGTFFRTELPEPAQRATLPILSVRVLPLPRANRTCFKPVKIFTLFIASDKLNPDSIRKMLKKQ